MATLIPEVSITDFKKLKVEQIKQLNCCEVFSNGEYLFTFINPSTSFIRVQSENNGQLSNSVSGKTLKQVQEASNG